mmetsp:Transcript_34863/g.78773  ORF Transcript_34863/g.78773 Transcript_34863/m.78773 type:complete len:80 (+) Transcript_34863:550-789(+)|eukprot:748651-Hanusia_phi.AAC.4
MFLPVETKRWDERWKLLLVSMKHKQEGKQRTCDRTRKRTSLRKQEEIHASRREGEGREAAGEEGEDDVQSGLQRRCDLN